MRRSLFVLLSAFLMFAPGAFGQDVGFAGRETLRGIKHFAVIIAIGDGAKNAGVSESLIRTDVELKLRSLGIRVMSAEEADKVLGRPHLLITVLAVKQDSRCSCGLKSALTTHYGYTVGTSFYQDAFLAVPQDDPDVPVSIETWGLLMTGIAEKAKVVADIRADVSRMVDTFANNYLAENPK